MKCFVIPNPDKKTAAESLNKVCGKLQSFGISVLLQDVFKELCTAKNIALGNFAELIENCDVVLAIGGDGTIIHNMKIAAKYQKPLAGVNLGRLGFLASVEMNELDLLGNLCNENYRLEHRMMLEVIVEQKGGKSKFYALNDAVISKGIMAKIVDLDVYCKSKSDAIRPNKNENSADIRHPHSGGPQDFLPDISNATAHIQNNQNKPELKMVGSYRADGIILSTPTGSTAYAMSAGGPIINPSIEAIALTPICPHSFSGARTILFNGTDTVKVIANEKYRNGEIYLSIDGESSVRLFDGDSVTVKKSKRYGRLINFSHLEFYEKINIKLENRHGNGV